ncbi:phage gp6-like head-tail connector protein (plasmid) [Levilactobacillus suantsaii]|uniref:head-tail connector protein n=1 Tax=Levilactobacillus suantsaii TaxID=2292255 RepID=UPI0015F61A0B|nr:head-tail connector protein [Levilactobacillus suantsaii]QMU09311.1 phage gp6-like head-tail connector protein [Levilactobacillus suantsaii]
MPTLDDLKLSLRLDGDADDELLTGYLNTAKSYITQAVGTESDSFYEDASVVDLFNTAVMALASAYYNYRSSLVPTTAISVNLPVNSIIGQLRGLYDLKMEAITDDQSN